MKQINIKFFFSLLLIFNNFQPIKSAQQAPTMQSHHIIGILGAMTGTYLTYKGITALYANIMNNQIEAKYPYAYAWYQDIAKKYPAAQLDKRHIFYSTPWMLQDFMEWQSIFGNIYCPEATLQIINEIYKKRMVDNKISYTCDQSDNDNITNTDEINLQIAEFLLIRQAYYCKHNTSINRPIQFIILSSATVALTDTICKLCNISLDSSSFSHIFLNLTLSSSILNIMSKDELAADAYAYSLSCDNNILKGAEAYLKDDTFNTFFNFNVALYDRIEQLTSFRIQLIMEDLFEKN